MLGFDNVLRALDEKVPPALLIEASDGAADGKRKIFGACHARGLKIQTIECLTGRRIELGPGPRECDTCSPQNRGGWRNG